MSLVPLFKSHYSIGRSILTLEKAGEGQENKADSIIDLAIINKISPVILVEDSISGFLEAYKNFKASNMTFVFGLRLTLTSDLLQKNEEALGKEHKIVIFAKNTEGYKRLSKISTLAATEGFYYQPRIDEKNLALFWDNKDLLLAIPFYDSFIWQNIMHQQACIPEFRFTKPVFFIESNKLPFDNCIANAVKRFVKDSYETLKVKSIYYNYRKDFVAYLTFRCINNRSTLNEPSLEGMSSSEFCLESYKETSI